MAIIMGGNFQLMQRAIDTKSTCGKTDIEMIELSASSCNRNNEIIDEKLIVVACPSASSKSDFRVCCEVSRWNVKIG